MSKNPKNSISEPIILYKNDNVSKTFATMRSKMLDSEGENTIRSIMMTSAIRGEGVSTVALNYAAVTAESDGSRVLLIDSNLRHPSLHKVFGVDNSVGLSDVLFADIDLKQAIQNSGMPNLDILPAGEYKVNLNRLFSRSSVKRALDRINNSYDSIILDSPAVTAFPDASTIAGAVDGVLLVIAAHRTRREVITEAISRLESSGAHLVGTTLNKRAYVIPATIYNKL